ncbi:MAG: UDP-N-acetylenolpyruvoylglucosamine reductase [Lautropia sp. SCN 69-89]|nr:MAG: UDP-N-acetylenolpyruvoylglucosamine reductase [Lautropia sp. SCN 69-89]
MAPIVRRSVSLKALNSFGVEARAERLVELRDAADLPASLALLREHPPALVLGGGSNLLFSRDPPGTVLRVMLAGRRLLDERAGEVLVEAAAGENWHAFVGWTLELGLNGLENLSLIPGSVGAAPVQNVGAYGVEVCECFDSLDAVSLSDGAVRRFDAADCGFGYRDSVFKRETGAQWLITAVRFRLSRAPRLRLDYGELRDELRARGVTSPGAREVADAVCAIRRRKLPDPAEIGNAGSFFKNPVVDRARAERLAEAHPGLPLYPGGSPATAKLSAAWMIDRCGWKGHRDGDAGVHDRHALVLVNHGHASGAQILALATRIRESVRQRFGIELEPEPSVV